jgi:hypothetical protein
VVIFAEADSIPDDGAAASAIRSLVSDGELSYDVVENHGGALVTRHIQKPGPTGLITTSTKPLPYQMDTRVLTVGITDTPEQTRRVLLAEAAAANGARQTPELAAFQALQRWLELAGDREVRIPFADDLARHVPVAHVRMRRDFPQLLTAIQALALLHQRRRGRDEDGRIVATLDDYRVARTLLLPSFTEAASAGISTAVRETVEAVALLLAAEGAPTAVTGIAVAGFLKLAKDTTWRRIQRCIELGLLVNLASRKSLPARLVLGDPLPDALPALPDPEALERELEWPNGHER